MKPLRRFIRVALRAAVVKRSLMVALLVGSILNLINQGDTLISGHFERLHLLKLLLTYMVPYLVSSYAMVTLDLEFSVGRHAIIETDLCCKLCGTHTHVHEHESIPECPNCGIKTRWKAV